MGDTRVEILSRRPSDGPALESLRRALSQLGIEARSRASHEAASGECDVRIVIAGSDVLREPRPRLLIALVDALALPSLEQAPGEDLEAADLILVPGPLHAQLLAPRLEGQVAVGGLARLDAVLAEPEEARRRARREIGVPGEVTLVVYAPSASPESSAVLTLGEGIAELAAAGPLVIVIPGEWPPEWIERHRALAARVPGLAVLEDFPVERALAAADAVVGDADEILLEAIALGKPVIGVGSGLEAACGTLELSGPLGQSVRSPSELPAAVREAISTTDARFEEARERLRRELCGFLGGASAAMATAIEERLRIPPVRTRSEVDVLRALEARAAFGELEPVRRELEAWIARHPSAPALRVLASILRRAGKTEAARESIERAEALARRELARVCCERGRVLVDAGVADPARASFERARALDGELAETHVGLGSLALHAGSPGEAEGCFREALEHEKTASAWAGLGLALLGQGQVREAFEPFQAALDLQPDHVTAVNGLVRAAFQSGDLAPALRRVEAFVELHPANLDLAFTLAGLRYQIGDREGARQMLERIELFRADYPGLTELRAKLAEHSRT